MEENLNVIEEVVEDVVEYTQPEIKNGVNGLIVAAGIGVATLVGTIVYKKVIKPRRDAKRLEGDIVDVECEDAVTE